MPHHISDIELQELRHLIGQETLTARKFAMYAQNCTNSELRSFFDSASRNAEDKVHRLMQFLT